MGILDFVKISPPAPPKHCMVFPYSSRPQTRRLVVRNATTKAMVVKMLPTCPQALHVDNSSLVVQPNEWNSTTMTLDPKKVKNSDDMNNHSLLVFCRLKSKSHEALLKEWMDNTEVSKDNFTHLAYNLKIYRSRDFAAPDTVVDLPGASELLEAPQGVITLYDPQEFVDCLTARNVESETATANELSETDLNACCPDSMAKTAHSIDEGTRTARKIGNSCFLVNALDRIYPGSGEPVEKNLPKSYFPCGQS
ncbi:unnamed protein product [Bursaphelenchus okinawaensis]|uniref:Major sperm protein n=1 Tax=Bursaphelenchus okinawaensis TaxID=465554 RepID=A0A811KVK9_9BILA|nr:unnamed protein product [Bursaphelenchus okinawaensis]CAG9112089.1 unnamed protein product [Bursaphelenchus okinawaensis]